MTAERDPFLFGIIFNVIFNYFQFYFSYFSYYLIFWFDWNNFLIVENAVEYLSYFLKD